MIVDTVYDRLFLRATRVRRVVKKTLDVSTESSVPYFFKPYAAFGLVELDVYILDAQKAEMGRLVALHDGWSIRGLIILVSDEWPVGFKVVHTVLWLVTAALSVLALREHPRLRNVDVIAPA